MNYNEEKWMTVEGVELLQEIGIKRGQVVLDFGCGTGYYTIPTAFVVGRSGRVYALDKDGDALDELMEKARKFGLSNIAPVKTSGELKTNLESNFFDVILLYDVLHHYYFSWEERERLLKEIHRVSGEGALLSVFPKHMNLTKIRKEVEDAGFHFKNRFFKKLIHYYNYEEGHILNFYK